MLLADHSRHQRWGSRCVEEQALHRDHTVNGQHPGARPFLSVFRVGPLVPSGSELISFAQLRSLPSLVTRVGGSNVGR